MTETERMLTQSLKRMEENCNARLTALSTRWTCRRTSRC